MKRPPMTPKEFAAEMRRIATSGDDPESTHGKADALMCKLLNQLGYRTGVALFDEMDKWYA